MSAHVGDKLETMQIPGTYGGSKEYIGWMDLDHVDTAVVLPGATLSAALVMVGMTCDREDRADFIRGYNNFISDFCADNPGRLLGGACVPHTSMDDAVDESVAVRPLAPARLWPIGLIHSKDYLSPAAKAYVDHILGGQTQP